MTENWEDIIKNKLQHDAVTPPPSAWEAINDSSWTQKIKSKFNLISGELESKRRLFL
jgi:hypothetical protein